MTQDLRVGQSPPAEKRNVMDPVRAAKVAAKRLGISADEYLQRRAAGEKWCWPCKAWHRLDAFNTDRSRRDGYANTCRWSQQIRYSHPDLLERN